MKFPGCNETPSASAQVVWSRKSEDKPDYYDTGVKFVEIDFLNSPIFLPLMAKFLPEASYKTQ